MISRDRFNNFMTKYPVVSWLLFSLFIGVSINFILSIIIFYINHPDRTDFSIFEEFNFISFPYVIIASMIGSFIFLFSDDIDYYKSQKNKLILNLGLRKLYKIMKRLPKFICKHCLKTIIVKNIDIVCPFCDAEFIVTDEEKTKQIGDVFAKGVRNLVDESTIEKILFDKCPACEGKIQHIDCYHCKKEIDLFEDYDENKLEHKRYGQI